MIFRSFQTKNKGLFYRWLLSYISILLIPIIISGAVGLMSTRVMTDEASSATDSMLKQVRRNIDDRLQSFREIAVSLSLNVELLDVMRAGSQFTNYHQYSISRLKRQLGSHVGMGKYIDNIFIYHKNTNSIICKDGKMSWDYFYDRYFSTATLDSEALYGLINETHIGLNYYLLDKKTADGGAERVVTLICSLPFARTKNPQGTLIISVPEEKLRAVLRDVRWIGEYELLMVEENGRIAISDGPAHLPADAIREIVADGPGRKRYSHQGRAYEVTVVSSDIADWKYVVVMPSEVFWEKTTFIRELTLIGVLLCMLAGGIVAYFFARRNYNPIHRMAEALTEKKAFQIKRGEAGYSFIHAVVNANIEEIRSAYSRLEKQDKALRNSALQSMLKGRADGEALRGEVEGSGPLFVVMLLRVEDCLAFETEGGERAGVSAGKLAMFALSNVLSELIAEDGDLTGELVEIDGMLACVVHFGSADIGGDIRALDDIVAKCQAYVQKRLHIVFSVAISDFHSDLSNLAEAYREASDAMGYRKFVGGSEVIKYDGIASERYQYDYSMQTETVLIHHIKVGDLKTARELVDRVLGLSLGSASYSGEMAKCLMYDLTGTIVKVMYEICDRDFIDRVQPLKRLIHLDDWMEAREEIMQMLGIVCGYVQHNSQNNHQLSRAVIEYINANFGDPNLSTSMISEKFSLTRTYLSMLFKAQTNQTMADYISRVRLEKAKGMLKESNASIKDIAIQAGFSNSSVFIRTFKKYEGITPGEYREIAVSY